ncbi:NRDE protein-domain-containing protein [Mycena metata]|uniref:NRDE protein-domain-containing protein n=1 Tax=Mycena metata TaxID=1033252 RepID=A0AAD7M721_9AGAR|nr:NRDE protein-domain-containing protein [Mycena metata]
MSRAIEHPPSQRPVIQFSNAVTYSEFPGHNFLVAFPTLTDLLDLRVRKIGVPLTDSSRSNLILDPILCTNRDEYLARPTLPAAFHSWGPHEGEGEDEAEPRVLSGRDAQAGGTWLGLTPTSGRIALLTNITETPQNFPSSRGALPSTFLSAAAPRMPLQGMYALDGQYAGFNMLLLEGVWDNNKQISFVDASILSNDGGGKPLAFRPLRPDERALGGLSNGIHVGGVAGEAWPKVVNGRTLFAAVVAEHDETKRAFAAEDAKRVNEEADDEELASRLFALLRTTAPNPPRAREELRQTICVEPIEIPTTANGDGRVLTPKYYATRTATVLLVRRTGEAFFVERDVWRLKADTPGGVHLYVDGKVGCDRTRNGAARAGDGERVFRVRLGERLPAAAAAGT